jgi:plastocyanin
MRTLTKLAATVVIVAALVGACGSDKKGSAATGSKPPVAVAAYDTLKYDATKFDGSADAKSLVRFQLTNQGALQHSLLVEGHERDLRLVVTSKGATDEGSIKLDPGSYTIYCDVAGHRAAGMEADLTVK